MPVVAMYLVGWPSKKILNIGCLALEKALAAAARCYALWGLGQELKHDKAEGERLARVDNIWKKGTKALVTIACLNCLHNKQGQERKEKCAQLLADNADFMDELLITTLQKQR